MANKLTDFFGSSMKFDASSVDLNAIESDPNQLMLIVSDVWLDQSGVLQKIRELLAGYSLSGIVPLAIIFMGDFLSEPFAYDGTTAKKYKGILSMPILFRKCIHQHQTTNRRCI
jgi:DNA polymerase epsilon subunit 2